MCKQCPNWKPAPYRPRPAFPPDEAAVELLVAGSPVAARPIEKRLAVARLTSYGYSARLISDRIGVAERTVARHRARLRQSG